jgi:hypothetical protein
VTMVSNATVLPFKLGLQNGASLNTAIQASYSKIPMLKDLTEQHATIEFNNITGHA